MAVLVMAVSIVAGCTTGPEPVPAEPAAPAVSTDTPTGAVQSFHRAWDTADCELFVAVTTELYREDLGPVDCPEFEATAAEQADWGWQVEITDESITDAEARVSSTESWTESDGVEQTQLFLYELVFVDDAWVIDNLR